MFAKKIKISQLVASLGPGILMATAAVGGSHLVASTKAGAIYGWQLAGLILLVNVFKYPFFLAGVQYTMATGNTLVEGYAKTNRFYLWAFLILSTISAVVNTAALLMFSASLLSVFIPFSLPFVWLNVIVLSVCLAILFLGHYKALDKLSKFIMTALVIATLIAASVAFGSPVEQVENFEAPSVWTIAAIGFIVVTMGWMPAPIEISALTSEWLKRQMSLQKVTSTSALFDFNVGYIGTAILAIVFLSLGAFMLHGSGIKLESSGVGFSHQLINLYTANIGQWAHYLIAIIAFFCIFGSTITVIDGYSRVISDSTRLLREKKETNPKETMFITIAISVFALYIVLFLTKALMPMLDFAMVLAFVTTPFFALLNYILVSKAKLEGPLAVGKKLKLLSITGLIYLFGFLFLFIWWKWFI